MRLYAHGRRRRSVLLLLLSVLFVVGPATVAGRSAARAEEVDLFHSYVQSGGASAITVVFNRENFLPFSPIVDLGVPRVRLEMGDSPTTSAKAAALDPGLLGAASGLTQILGVPPGVVPPYPLYADAKFPTGPEQATAGVSQDIPSAGAGLEGVTGHSEATAERAAAETSVSNLKGDATGLAGLIAIRGAATEGELLHKERSLEGMLRTRLTGVELLGGLVEIGTIETKVRLKMTDPRKAPEVASATTTMGDVRIAGVGLLPAGTVAQLADAVAQINELVSPSGLTLEVAVPTREEGVLGITGLRMTFDGEIQPGERDFVQVSLASARLSYFSELVEVPTPPATPAPSLGGSFADPGSGTSNAGLSLPDLPPVDLPPSESASAPVASGTRTAAQPVVDIDAMAAAVGRITAGLSIGGLLIAALVIAGRFGFIFPGAEPTATSVRRRVEDTT